MIKLRLLMMKPGL